MLLLEILEDPVVKPFSMITAQERKEWNNGENISSQDMMEVMRGHNPGVSNEDEASLIKLRLARIDDRPIAGFLPELP